jgi:hypothetical protein
LFLPRDAPFKKLARWVEGENPLAPKHFIVRGEGFH